MANEKKHREKSFYAVFPRNEPPQHHTNHPHSHHVSCIRKLSHNMSLCTWEYPIADARSCDRKKVFHSLDTKKHAVVLCFKTNRAVIRAQTVPI